MTSPQTVNRYIVPDLATLIPQVIGLVRPLVEELEASEASRHTQGNPMGISQRQTSDPKPLPLIPPDHTAPTVLAQNGILPSVVVARVVELLLRDDDRASFAAALNSVPVRGSLGYRLITCCSST